MKKLYRSKTDVKISGVCGGLAGILQYRRDTGAPGLGFVPLLTSGIIGLSYMWYAYL